MTQARTRHRSRPQSSAARTQSLQRLGRARRLIVHEGVSCDLLTAETRFWPRSASTAPPCTSRGRGDFCNLFLIDIPPGASTEPQRHLYEEVIYVVEGRGSTRARVCRRPHAQLRVAAAQHVRDPAEREVPAVQRRRQEARAASASTTSLPLMMKIFHNDGFIFDNSALLRTIASARTSTTPAAATSR